jgi:hypothetical protein
MESAGHGQVDKIKKSRLGGLAKANSAQVNRVKRLFKGWLQDASGYDEDAWPQLNKALNENHSKSHNLFDE